MGMHNYDQLFQILLISTYSIVQNNGFLYDFLYMCTMCFDPIDLHRQSPLLLIPCLFPNSLPSTFLMREKTYSICLPESGLFCLM
jgi:hypothetical protein